MQIDGGYVHGYWLEANEEASTPPTPDETTYEVQAYLNIRQGPTLSSSVLGVYSPGTRVAGTPAENGWVKTSDGYVYGSYVKPVDEAPTPPTPEPGDPAPGDTYRIDRSVNLRSGPGMGHEVIGMAPRGAR
ncbi:hypothetical protein BJF82_04380 [Kytococcus sp. CUA-901]|nr:hypothetical protein BJF82_04380 [Kytococcus sp. CUA-901]